MSAEPVITAIDVHDDGHVECWCRGWHQSRFIGGKLRWLGKYLP